MNPSTGHPIEFPTNNARKFDAVWKPHPIILPMLQQALQEVIQLNSNYYNNNNNYLIGHRHYRV
jgi:hypothetical protein